MARHINGRVLVVAVAVTALAAAGVHLVHGYQVRRHAQAFLARADEAERAGDLARCADDLRQYLAYVPADADACGRLGDVLDRGGRTRAERWQAFAALEKAVRLDPGRHDLRRQLVRVAMTPEVDRLPDAVEHLGVLIRAFPDDGGLEHLLGRCHEMMGHYPGAVAGYRRAIAKHAPDSVGCAVACADVLRRRLDRPTDAARVMDGLVKQVGSAAAYLARSRHRREAGDPAGAAADLAEARRRAPDAPDVLVAVADAAVAAKRYDEGRATLEAGLRKHPGDLRLVQALARLEIRAGRPAAAIAGLRRALEAADRPAPDDLWDLADLLIDAGEIDGPRGARALLAELRRAGMAPEPIDYLEGRIRFRQGRWLEAVRLLERARPGLGRAPELVRQADLLLARCHGELGNPDQQVVAYRRALAADPSASAARLGLAAALLTLGRLDEAIAEYRREPQARLVLARLLVLRNLRLPTARRKWDEVERLLDEAARAQPDAVEVPILRAQALVARGGPNVAAARRLLEQACARHSGQLKPRAALADLADRLADHAGARAALDEARRRSGDGVDLRLACARHWSGQPGPDARRALARLEEGLDRFPADDQARLLDGLAQAHYYAGARREAGRLWGLLAERQPHNLRLHLLLFDLALEAGDDAAMSRRVAQVRALEGEDGDLWRYGEAARLIARAHGGDAALGRARALLAQAAGHRPAWPRVPLLLARIDELAGDSDQAVEHYRDAIRLGECQPDVIRRAAQLLCERRRYLEADVVIQALPAQAPVTGLLGRVAAEVSLHNRDTERALDLARQAVPAGSRDYRDQVWLGQVLAAAGRLDQAEAAHRRAVAMAPAAADALVALVQFLARTGAPARAEAAVAEAQARPGARLDPVALAQCHEAIGRPGRAEAAYRAAVHARPADPAVLRAAADFYLRRGRAADAEPLLQSLLAARTRAPAADAAWARRSKAVVLAGAGDYRRFREALALLDVNEAGGPTAPEDLRARAAVLATRPERRREAIRLFENLARRWPPAAEEQFLLARLYERDGRPQRAYECTLGLLAGGEERPAYLAFHVGLVLRTGNLAEASYWFDKLEQAAPGAPETAELQARLLHRQGKPAEAVAALDRYARTAGADLVRAAGVLEDIGQPAAAERLYRAHAAADGRPERVLPLALFLGRHRRPAEALAVCRDARRTCPAEAVAVATLAVLRAGAPAADAREARAWLQTAVTRVPAAVGLLMCQADLDVIDQNYTAAEALYRRALQAAPEHVPARNNLAWLLALRGQPAEALAVLEPALAAAGPHAELLDTRALANLALGRVEAAVQDLEAAVAQAPSAAGYFHLARARLQATRAAEARDALRKAQAAGLTAAALPPLERAAYDELLGRLRAG